MSEVHRGVTLNQQGDAQPNGTIENTAFHNTLDGLLIDCIDTNIDIVNGHRHHSVYDSGGTDLVNCNNGASRIDVNGVLALNGDSQSLISNSTSSGRYILQLRARTDAFTPGNDGAGINLYGDDDPSNPGHILWFVAGYSQGKLIPSSAVATNAYFGVGNEHDPRSPVEIYFADEHPILQITGAGGTTYDPQVAFHTGTGATPAKKAGLGVDAADDKLKFTTGSGALGGSSEMVLDGTKLGIGTDSPEARLHIKDTSATARIMLESNTKAVLSCTNNSGREFLEIRPTESLSDGAGINLYGDLDSGNPGAILMFTNGNIRTRIDSSGYMYVYQMRSGATQVAAGASAGELWKTSGHATLPDNVIMHGV